MALTARATSPPTWEAQIVPTLRKRLEHESRALSKRMSQPPPPEDPRPSMARSTSDRPSHIPRPSMQSLLSDDTHKTRPRTHSTPRPFDSDILTPDSSRSASPAVQTTPRPSRIPTRPRAGSRVPDTFPPSPDPSPDLWPVQEVVTKLTPPTPDANRRRKRETFVPPPPSDNDEILFDEPAPFATNDLAPRPSLDEYEHWYRGEGRGGGGRNGGYGEIRIATRTEMLEIASFGHPPSRSNSHGHGFNELGWRTKAYDDSTVGTRSMWHDENAENVLDEAPLTDLDDVDSDSMYHLSQGHTVDSHPARTSQDHEPDPEPDGPAPVTPARPPPSRIARATSPPRVGPGASTTSLVSARSARSPTPSKTRTQASRVQSPKAKSPARGTNANATKSPKAGTSKSPSRAGTSKSPSRAGTSKSPARAGTSQPTPSGSTPKSPKTPKGAASPKTPSPRTRVRAQSTPRTKRLSTGGAGNLADAIPQIPPSQPVPDDGNWDDVVLPTVARRMQGGDVVMLERKPREQVEEILPPAPGTFGYREREREKVRKQPEVEEFGAWDVKKPKVDKVPERKIPSPPPFSDYTPAPPVDPPRRQSIRTTPPAAQPSGMVITEAELRTPLPDKGKDSHGAGCCKCVVM